MNLTFYIETQTSNSKQWNCFEKQTISNTTSFNNMMIDSLVKLKTSLPANISLHAQDDIMKEITSSQSPEVYQINKLDADKLIQSRQSFAVNKQTKRYCTNPLYNNYAIITVYDLDKLIFETKKQLGVPSQYWNSLVWNLKNLKTPSLKVRILFYTN